MMLAGVDWERFTVPAIVWTLIASALAILAKGQGSRLVHYFFRAEEPRALDSIIDTLDSKRGRDRLRVLMDDLYSERIRRNDEALRSAVETANANKERLEAVAASQLAQGATLREVESRVREVPRLINALESLAETTSEISKEMQAINLSMARIDEREKERERRWHDMRPNPGDRMGDPPNR